MTKLYTNKNNLGYSYYDRINRLALVVYDNANSIQYGLKDAFKFAKLELYSRSERMDVYRANVLIGYDWNNYIYD